MVNIKEEFRTATRFSSQSEAITNDPPEQVQVLVFSCDEDWPITPYEARAIKRAGTFQLQTAIKPNRRNRSPSHERTMLYSAGSVSSSSNLSRPTQMFDFDIDEIQGPSAISVPAVEFQGAYIPTGQLFSALEVESTPPATISLPRRILRAHFLTDVISAIDNLSKHAGNQTAADYANSLFKAMRVFRDTLSQDPFTAIMTALHDALAYKNRWADYSAAQYQQAKDTLVRYGNQDLSPDKALKAVSAIEAIGFDTTPFEAISDFETKSSSADES
jgi:hypothetical protein